MRFRVLGAAAVLATSAIASGGAPPPAPSFTWHLVDGKHWQIATPAGEDPAVTDAAEGNRGACPAGMIEVNGKMRVVAMGDEVQKTVCTRWINREFPERCATFDRAKWLAITDK